MADPSYWRQASHRFKGRHDRDCDWCELPDRAAIHKNVTAQVADPETVLIAQALELLATVEQADEFLVTDEILAEADKLRVLADTFVEVV